MKASSMQSWDVFPVNKRHYQFLTKIKNNPGTLTTEISRTKCDKMVLAMLYNNNMIRKEFDKDSIRGIRWFITEHGEETIVQMDNLIRMFPGVEL